MDKPQDPDLVARELNALAEGPAGTPRFGTETARLEAWLAALGPNRASDLLLVAGAPPCIRVDSQIRATSRKRCCRRCRRTRAAATTRRTSPTLR